MEALRKIVRGTDLPNMLELPENFKDKRVEVIIIPVDDEFQGKKGLKKAGALSEYAKPKMINCEKTAWEKAMREKHENR